MRHRGALGGKQVDLAGFEVYAVDRHQPGPHHAQRVQARQRARAVFANSGIHFLARLVHVQVDGQVEFFGKRDDAPEARIRNRVGRVRRERE